MRIDMLGDWVRPTFTRDCTPQSFLSGTTIASVWPFIARHKSSTTQRLLLLLFNIPWPFERNGRAGYPRGRRGAPMGINKEIYVLPCCDSHSFFFFFYYLDCEIYADPQTPRLGGGSLAVLRLISILTLSLRRRRRESTFGISFCRGHL